MLGGVCNFFSSVSPQQKFEAVDRPVLRLSLNGRPMLQLGYGSV